LGEDERERGRQGEKERKGQVRTERYGKKGEGKRRDKNGETMNEGGGRNGVTETGGMRGRERKARTEGER